MLPSNQRYLWETRKSFVYRVDKLGKVCFSSIASTNKDCKWSKINRSLPNRSEILNGYRKEVGLSRFWN